MAYGKVPYVHPYLSFLLLYLLNITFTKPPEYTHCNQKSYLTHNNIDFKKEVNNEVKDQEWKGCERNKN